MATKKEYPGFPKTYVKGDSGRVANNPTDAVNLEHRGYKASEDAPAEEAKTEGSGSGDSAAAAGAGNVEATSTKPKPNPPTAPQGNTRPLAH